jgi:hypothetical protein
MVAAINHIYTVWSSAHKQMVHSDSIVGKHGLGSEKILNDVSDLLARSSYDLEHNMRRFETVSN